jgi:hypothetical protein
MLVPLGRFLLAVDAERFDLSAYATPTSGGM